MFESTDAWCAGSLMDQFMLRLPASGSGSDATTPQSAQPSRPSAATSSQSEQPSRPSASGELCLGPFPMLPLPLPLSPSPPLPRPPHPLIVIVMCSDEIATVVVAVMCFDECIHVAGVSAIPAQMASASPLLSRAIQLDVPDIKLGYQQDYPSGSWPREVRIRGCKGLIQVNLVPLQGAENNALLREGELLTYLLKVGCTRSELKGGVCTICWNSITLGGNANTTCGGCPSLPSSNA